jgi:hypothetical protein
MITSEWKHLSKRAKVVRVCDCCNKEQPVTVESLRKYPDSDKNCKTCTKLTNNKPVSEQTKINISKAKKGKKTGPRPIEYIQKYYIGENNPFYGKKHSKESMVQAQKTRAENPDYRINFLEGLKKRDLSGPKNGMFGKSPAKPKRSKLKYKNFTFRSSWELKFAVHLDSLDCDWGYEPFTLDLGPLGGYTPDFIINNCIYEVKGYYWNSDEKFLEAQKLYKDKYNFVILDQKKLKEMGVL